MPPIVPVVHLAIGEAGCRLASREGGTAVVIDALRASVTITLLLARGLKSVIAAAEVDDALRAAGGDGDAVLVGERDSLKIPGFHLGNSPSEVENADLVGTTAVFTSTTGSARLIEAGGADLILVGCAPNASATAAVARLHALRTGAPVFIVPAGSQARPQDEPAEDIAAAAAIIDRMGEVKIATGAKMYRSYSGRLAGEGIEAIFRDSPHGRELVEKGFEPDVVYCSRIDTLPVVPYVTGTVAAHSGGAAAFLRRFPGI